MNRMNASHVFLFLAVTVFFVVVVAAISVLFGGGVIVQGIIGGTFGVIACSIWHQKVFKFFDWLFILDAEEKAKRPLTFLLLVAVLWGIFFSSLGVLRHNIAEALPETLDKFIMDTILAPVLVLGVIAVAIYFFILISKENKDKD